MPYTRKFKVGDEVVINSNAPLWLLDEIRRNRRRTVVAVFYDHGAQHIRYYLGANYKGADIRNYPFRACQLGPAVDREAGRPRLKRKYSMRKGAKDREKYQKGEGFPLSWILWRNRAL